MLLLRFHFSNGEIEKAAHTLWLFFILCLTSLKIHIYVNFETVLTFTLLDCITFGDVYYRGSSKLSAVYQENKI